MVILGEDEQKNDRKCQVCAELNWLVGKNIPKMANSVNQKRGRRRSKLGWSGWRKMMKMNVSSEFGNWD